MTLFYILLGIFVGLSALYLLALRGRRGHRGFAALTGWSYAHRGLHDEALPENSMGAFRAALEHGYGIELDVHLLADGNLAVIHDSSLKRTVGADVMIEALTTEQLSQYRLLGSQEGIPTFRQVLELFAGKAPMIIELKTYRGNFAPLCQKVMEELAEYQGQYCLESFDPFCMHYIKKHYPEVIRGQLACNFLGDKDCPFPWLLRLVATCQLLNFLSRPDFTAYRFEDRRNLSVFLVRKVWGVHGVSWTIRSEADYGTALKEGWLPIFENFKPNSERTNNNEKTVCNSSGADASAVRMR